MTALEGKALLDHGKAIAKRYARSVGPDLAEELRAEAVLRALGSPPPDGRLRPWLERIYRNLLVDRWRRVQPRMVDLDDVPGLASPGTPEDAVLRRERRRLVRASLAGLPSEARRALLARYYGQLDDRAAAGRLGIAAITIRTRVHRALARLRLRLGDLRALCPPLLGKLGTQAVAVGMAPVMVAALVVVGAASPPAPAPEIISPSMALPVTARIRPRPIPTAEATRPREVERAPVRTARRTTASLPSSLPAPVAAAILAYPEPEPVVGKILHPEAIDILAAPAAPVVPCMIEAPSSFLTRIEWMVEDLP
jgi:RNA polymerase sigma-70 factor (ECF subfamily)